MGLNSNQEDGFVRCRWVDAGLEFYREEVMLAAMAVTARRSRCCWEEQLKEMIAVVMKLTWNCRCKLQWNGDDAGIAGGIVGVNVAVMNCHGLTELQVRLANCDSKMEMENIAAMTTVRECGRAEMKS
ncbi:hypothetical protein C5167_003438 [Papaver somniferum]|uniref:Uncharacterized protein n=1 Tax=Papaver somniferum TaxID=3469 RepID=A0A4Y7L495_PAPSO|nr:hypothetical protein C5167_003438 [Papaver somniferum]